MNSNLWPTTLIWGPHFFSGLRALSSQFNLLAISLKTRRAVAAGEEIVLILALNNVGRSPASDMVVELLPGAGYTVRDGLAQMAVLPAGRTADVELRARPSPSVDTFHAEFRVTYDDRERPGKTELFAERVRLVAPPALFRPIPNPYAAGSRSAPVTHQQLGQTNQRLQHPVWKLPYLAYLLRLRRDNETSPWRVTVENPHTGQRWGFATLRRFVAFLEKQTGERLEQSTGKEGGNLMSEESKAIVHRAFEAWNTGNLDLFDEIWSADYVHHDPSEPDVRSLEDYKRYVAYVHSRYPGLHFAIEDMLAEGDKVATRYTWRITDSVGKEDRPPTGRQVTVTGTAIYRLAGGHIAEMWVNWDELGYYRQLGVVPEMG